MEAQQGRSEMILLEIDLVYKYKQGALQRTVYPVALPTQSISEA